MNILFNWSDRRWPETKRGEDKGEEAAKITLFSPQKNHIVSPNTNYPIIPNYPIPFLDCPVSRDDNTDNSLQETDTYRQIIGRVILQPDITQSYYYQDSYPTGATSMHYDRQLIRRE